MNSSPSRERTFIETLGIEVLRAFVMYVIFIVLESLLSVFFVMGSSQIIKEMNSTNRPMIALSTLSLVFAFYSLSRAFELYDLSARRAFLDGHNGRYTLLSDIKRTFGCRILLTKLLCQLLTVLLLVLILPYQLGYGNMIRAIFWSAKDSSGFLFNIVKIAIVCPSVVVLMLLAKTSAHKWWVIARSGEREKMNALKRPVLRLLFEVVKISVIYSAAFSVLPMVIMLIISAVLMAELFSTQPWILLVIAIFLAALASIRAVVTLIRRYRFYKKLKATLGDEGYTLSDEYRPVISAVFMREGANFRISKGEKSYTCKLVGTTKRRLPVYINTEGFYTVKKTVSFLKITLFHIMNDIDYTFECTDARIVVFSPMPKRVFINYGRTDTAFDDGDGGGLPTSVAVRASIMSGGKSSGRSIHGPGYISDVDRGIIKPFETGEKIGNYKFFTPDGFISAVDNDCLDR